MVTSTVDNSNYILRVENNTKCNLANIYTARGKQKEKEFVHLKIQKNYNKHIMNPEQCSHLIVSPVCLNLFNSLLSVVGIVVLL